MSIEEIVAVIIDSNSVTTVAGAIDAAMLFGRSLEYVSRDRARSLAVETGQPEWETLANAAALFVLVGGKRYRQHSSELPVSFSLFGSVRQLLPTCAG